MGVDLNNSKVGNNMCKTNILDLDCDEARSFFLKHESYCNIDLPQYFSFSKLLEKLSKAMQNKNLSNISVSKNDINAIGKLDNVNYFIYANKDGRLSWRPLQIIHPLVYVDLVHKITEEDNWEKLKARFSKFQQNKKIECLSIPVCSKNKKKDKAQQILHWWENVEQKSIALSLEYNYVFDTDIADCYGSIYTHSIAWAVESKCVAKTNHSDSLLGNYIDKKVQSAQYQQTNGIPQGSVLMDFIAEIVLGYIDRILTHELKNNYNEITDYKILRYRDDYRIFVNNKNDGENILKLLSQIMIDFGLKLNSSKTKENNDVITQSIKKDKMLWLSFGGYHRNLQKQLLLIRQHSINFPNSGSVTTELNKLDKKIERLIKKNRKIHSTKQLISIAADIAYNNPKTLPVCCSIISKLLQESKDNELSELVYNKLIKMPNSGFAEIWLQRMLKSDVDRFKFSEKMCLFVSNQKPELWNNEWIKSQRIKSIIENTDIFLKDEFNELDNIISNEEIDLFTYQ
ncbi:RNA-directed DNA polymerase [Neisseria sp. ZJ106]|uniref:RNA-directed DNA polymerase n=1 Tax=Neisseria lisongii TaxID=2912188 RepID=A0ABY7RH05_9NEIS|nr:RNA-directed DNA polymerase [Neisseria lisongii]MCF7521759.1 RNA-directed DNA polymerase [Neisseria lisongii]WCL70802.1 RNA-directed DNA polymerase [Neisseria lisongii]